MTQKYTLIVEGADDMHFCVHLLKNKEIPLYDENNKNPDAGVKIIPTGGIKPLLEEELPSQLKSPDKFPLGIVVDADGSAENRLESIKHRLVEKGYPEENLTSLSEDGIIIKHEDLRTVGIWIMPDNKTSGALESFIKNLIPEEDELIKLAEKAVENLPKEKNEPNDNWKSKAIVHTWLAWQEEPGTPMGQAITKQYLLPDHETAGKFVEWIKELFS